jgi:hypothetical protein
MIENLGRAAGRLSTLLVTAVAFVKRLAPDDEHDIADAA